jgi:diguanylate cyclase (GGDEF)-like protein
MANNENDDSNDNNDGMEKTSVVASETFKQRVAEAIKTPPCLVLLVGPASYVGKQWPITGVDLVIGRAIQSYIFVDDRSVSKSHAKLSFSAGEVSIIDLEATNRTILNGQVLPPLVPIKLNNNDQIKAGNVIFKFLEKGSLEAMTNQATYDRGQTDALTNIFNKGALLAYAPETFRRSKMLKTPLSLAVFDIDHFKRINDSHGHPAGDQILKEMALVVSRKLIRSEDYFARFGGEEFVVILNNTDLKQALDIGERIRHTIETHPFVADGKNIPVTISVGVAEKTVEMNSWDDLFKQADDSLYASKGRGRNCVTSL